jgi:hypothetical protein
MGGILEKNVGFRYYASYEAMWGLGWSAVPWLIVAWRAVVDLYQL